MSRTKRIDRIDKNYIINGGFEIWQRGTSFTGTAINFDYTADRWQYQEGASVGAARVQIVGSDSPNSVLSTAVQVDALTGLGGSLAATDLQRIRTMLEGRDVKNLEGKEITVGFWVKASRTGLMPVSILTYGDVANSTYTSEVEILQADTWEYKTIFVDALPNDITPGSARGLEVNFMFASGSNFHTAATDTWISGSIGTATGTNFLESTADYVRLTQVQLVEGHIPLDGSTYSRAGRNYAEEFQLCQRYYEEFFINPNSYADFHFLAFNSTNAQTTLRYSLKRNIPSVFFTTNGNTNLFNQLRGGGNVSTVTSISFSNIQNTQCRFNIITSGGMTANTVYASLTSLISEFTRIRIDAEL